MVERTQSVTSLERVFVIADDAGTRESIAMSFEISYPGVEVRQFVGVDGVIDDLKNADADLITVDLGLPDGDGLSLIRDIRANSKAPIIVVTAREDDSTLLAAIRLGADEFLIKPVSLVALQAHVDAVVRLQNRPARSASSNKLIVLGECTVDLERGVVTINNVEC